MLRIKKMIVSDLHIGSAEFRAKLFLDTMRKYDYDELIIVGDLYEHENAICENHWDVVNYLHDVRKKIVYVEGNHDPIKNNIMAKLLGLEVLPEYHTQINGRTVCFRHGHQFDRLLFILSEPWLDNVVTKSFYSLQKMNISPPWVTNCFTYSHKRLSSHFSRAAVRYAQRHGFDSIVCGHTHKPEEFVSSLKNNGEKIKYVNCGSWANGCCSCVIVDNAGTTKLKLVEEPSC